MFKVRNFLRMIRDLTKNTNLHTLDCSSQYKFDTAFNGL